MTRPATSNARKNGKSSRARSRRAGGHLAHQPPGTEAPKQLESGGQKMNSRADGAVRDADVVEASDSDDSIPEAELLSEFDKLEEKQQAES